jgi:hypothetical protein
MIWDIRFKKDGKEFKLGILSDVIIESSVDNLADAATIVLPEAVMNDVLNIQEKISRGTEVIIKLGYDKLLQTEFVGFVQEITTNDSTLKIVCEDALFLFRVAVKNQEMRAVSLKNIAQTLVDQIDLSFTVSCDYDINYEKFVIHQATGYDVLKKLQEETKANIYFDNQNKILHIHPPYLEKGGDASYAMHVNIEKSSLEYKRALDTKLEVTVDSTDIKGKVTTIIEGTTGGDRVIIRVGPMDEASMRNVAKAALVKNSFDGYDGTFDGWLIPFVQPSFTARIEDLDYPYKTGNYYVVAVRTSFSEAGGKRNITLGIKL